MYFLNEVRFSLSFKLEKEKKMFFLADLNIFTID